jgi:hypothetical protein
VDGQLEIRRVGVDGSPSGEPVTPDGTAVWPTITAIREVWLLPDEQVLAVVGHRGFETLLHSIEADESADAVGLTAIVGYTQEAARWRVEASEAPGMLLVALTWRTEVRLRDPLSGRVVIDRGLVQSQSFVGRERESVSGQAIEQLKSELSAAKTPAERRRIRATIKATLRNPFKAMDLGEPTSTCDAE